MMKQVIKEFHDKVRWCTGDYDSAEDFKDYVYVKCSDVCKSGYFNYRWHRKRSYFKSDLMIYNVFRSEWTTSCVPKNYWHTQSHILVDVYRDSIHKQVASTLVFIPELALLIAEYII
jgi:hypothetical protein